MRDLYSNIGVVGAITPAVQAASITGAVVDIKGFRRLAFVLTTGAIVGDGKFGAKLEVSDDNTTFVDAPPEFVASNAPAELTADGAFKIGFHGYHRYVRLVLTKASGTSIVAGAVAVLGDPAIAPVA